MKKNIMKTKTALILGIIFIVLIISAVYYFFDVKYQKEYEDFPILSVVLEDGRKVEMLPIEYEWTYKGNTKSYKLDGDFKTYDYPEEYIIFSSTNIQKIQKVESNVRYKTKFFAENDYQIINGKAQERSGGNSNGDISKMIRNGEICMQQSSNPGEFVNRIKITYKNQGYVSYAIKIFYFDDEINKAKNYQNLENTNIEKIKELIGKLKYKEFLNDVNVEGNTINLKYDYYIRDDALEMNNMILFACIPKLDKIIYTAGNKKTFYFDKENQVDINTEIENKVFLKSDYEKSNFNIETLLKAMQKGV